MKLLVFVLVLFSVSISCTKKTTAKKAEEVFLNYDSPIKYKFGEIADKTQVAMVAGSPVSWEQLMSQDVALKELQDTYNEKALAFSYAWAASMADGDSNVEVTVFIPEPANSLGDVLAKSTVEKNDNVTVKYDNSDNKENLASANGKTVTWKEFVSANIQHGRHYGRLFQQRMQRLNGIVVRRLLLDAANNENIPMEAYVKKHIMPEAYEPTEADVRAFAADKKIAESNLTEDMMKRLKEIVRQNNRDTKINNYIAKNLVKEPIVVAFDSPKLAIKTPEITESMPQWGKGQGPELVFVGHWNCENCGENLKSFLATKDSFEKNMQGAFIYSFPDRDREARMGAEAGLCVESQKPSSFWIFIGKIMDLQNENLEEKINVAVEGAGVDFDKFRECFLKREYQQVVDTHLAYSKSLGVTSAPLMILQGNVLDLPVTVQGLTDQIKEIGLPSGDAKKKGLWAKIKGFFGF